MTSRRRGGEDEARQRVVIAHGGGGELMVRLIREHLLPPIENETLSVLADGAVLPQLSGEIVLTTDSYVVTPIEFPGGDIGRLAVAGTINDLAVMGADAVALTLALIIEEGLPLDVLDRVMASVAATAHAAGVQVVTGDTKVIERRRGPDESGATAEGLFINTAGLGRLRPGVRLGLDRVSEGDAIIVNGEIAEHGLAVMSARGGLEFEAGLQSDVAPLNGLTSAILNTDADVKFMRDATRGGVAGVLADIAAASRLSIEVDETSVPLSVTARHAAEMLGLDPLTVANEGKLVTVVAGRDAEKVLSACRRHPLGKKAARIGRVLEGALPLVELITRAGGRRVVQRPYGEELPRIC